MRRLLGFFILLMLNTTASFVLFHNKLTTLTAIIVISLASIGGMVYQRSTEN